MLEDAMESQRVMEERERVLVVGCGRELHLRESSVTAPLRRTLK
jgi:hypothetical protein